MSQIDLIARLSMASTLTWFSLRKMI
jgi:hypothetical protein